MAIEFFPLNAMNNQNMAKLYGSIQLVASRIRCIVMGRTFLSDCASRTGIQTRQIADVRPEQDGKVELSGHLNECLWGNRALPSDDQNSDGWGQWIQ